MSAREKPSRNLMLSGSGARVIIFALASVAVLVLGLMPQDFAIHVSSSDKIDHFAAFAVLMIVGQFAFPAKYHLWVGLGLICFGGAIELLQAIPSLGRSPDWIDWLVEVAAICVMGPLYARLAAAVAVSQ